MKELIVVFVLSTLLWAVNPWAICPQDGEEANYTTTQAIAVTITVNIATST